MKTPCVIWTRGKVRGGYGYTRFKGQRMLAHRAAWIVAHGPIPYGLLVCHACDNPPCVNPEHLFLGTQSDNIRDSVNKGRWKRQDGATKLTPDEVNIIRQMRGLITSAQLAKRFRVEASTIRKAWTNKSHKNLLRKII